jgi:hypothetical protein
LDSKIEYKWQIKKYIKQKIMFILFIRKKTTHFMKK